MFDKVLDLFTKPTYISNTRFSFFDYSFTLKHEKRRELLSRVHLRQNFVLDFKKMITKMAKEIVWLQKKCHSDRDLPKMTHLTGDHTDFCVTS